MKFITQKYKLEDKIESSFIDDKEIETILESKQNPSIEELKEVLAKAENKQRLTLEEVAVLINTVSKEGNDLIKEKSLALKKRIYGNRIVLFAPLYVGSDCVNECEYCGFKASNKEITRETLDDKKLDSEVRALQRNGQKRLILVYGEHPRYDADFIANNVKQVYAIKEGQGEIRRVNINAAPMSFEGYEKVKESGIGTFQIFQETYHRATYERYHTKGYKKDFDKRLTALDTAQRAGIDDVGIGVLFGLYDWRFEVMALVRHTNHLEACFNVGPHTISFPRFQEASNASIFEQKYKVSDEDFLRLITILRLAVPYAGLILTAREPEEIRREALKIGVTQIDGGTKIGLNSYNKEDKKQDLNNQQFNISDDRSLHEIIEDLVKNKELPSFCTACYRKGRTGEHFLEFAVPGFIKKFCTPNALFTFCEYLLDYADEKLSKQGWKLVQEYVDKIEDNEMKSKVENIIERIKKGERDLNF